METVVRTSSSATFSNGRAQTTVVPSVYGTSWTVTRMVSSTTNTSTTAVTLKVYRDVEQPGNLVDRSYSANLDVSETNLKLNTSETLVFVWEGGVDGTTATIVVEGIQTR